MKRGGIKVPSELGGKGLPPGMKTHYRKSSKSGGINSPVEVGQKGMPVHKRPSSTLRPEYNE